MVSGGPSPAVPGPSLPVSLDVSAVPPRPAGAGRYTVELARALLARPDVALTVVTRRGDTSRWGTGADSVVAGTGSQARVLGVVPDARPLRLAWERGRLGPVVRRAGAAVHHGPHYTMPGRGAPPCVVTVHDCTFFDHPEWHERSKVAVFRRAIRRAAEQAAVVVCVSRHTATRLAEVCPVRAPVVVAPHGVDHDRFVPDEPSPGADRLALDRLGIDSERPLVVFIGTVEPRKEVARLVEAFDRVAAAHPDALLVLAGQPGWGEEPVARALAATRHAERVVRTGYVPDAAVPALLRQAAVVAYPSLAEGYGLPALEALACGAPLLTTAGTAMEELAAGAAVVVPPGDTVALTAGLEHLLDEDPAASARMTRRAHGLVVAAARTWAASAERHMAAYRAAAAGEPPPAEEPSR